MSQANLSETLFKPRFKHPETSTLVQRTRRAAVPALHSTLDGDSVPHWYRIINRLMWIWRGVDPRDILDVQARIVTSDAERTQHDLFDTVVGYRGGNWIYEWSKQAMHWQQQASSCSDESIAGSHWLQAANLYSIAAYPYLKGDALSEQAQVMSNRAYEQAANRLTGRLRQLNFPLSEGGTTTGFLHMPSNSDGPFPTVLVCGALDSLQSDYYNLFAHYLAPLGIAMLTIDMPSAGFSSKWKLTQDSSILHQQVLRALPDIPWIDHTRVAAFGFRFGANVAVRLAYLESHRLRAVACLGPVVHALLTETQRQGQVPDMSIDVLSNRLGMNNVSESNLSIELNRYSLKTQGLLGRRCPTPMLSGYWSGDLFSPEEESKLIVSSSVDGKLLSIASHPVYKSFDKALANIVGWVNQRLR